MILKGVFARFNLFSLILILFGTWIVCEITISSWGLPLTMLLFGINNVDAVSGMLNAPTARELTDPLTLFGIRIHYSFLAIGRLVAVLLFLYLIHGNPLTRMGAAKRPSIGLSLLAILSIVAFIPLINYAEQLNSLLPLGEEFKILKETSYAISQTQQALMADTSVLEFTFNILIFVVLAAIWEEWIFRGLLQPMFMAITKNVHAGIWLTAILFSAIHLQFEGFLPRMLAGALLGYLFYWSGTIWLPIIGHMFNNLFYIVLDKLERSAQVVLPESFDLPLVIISSAVFALLFYGVYRLSSLSKNAKLQT